MKITKRQLRRIIRGQLKENQASLRKGLRGWKQKREIEDEAAWIQSLEQDVSLGTEEDWDDDHYETLAPPGQGHLRKSLRRVQELFLCERGEANVTQIKKYESEIREWVETLVDSMADHVSEKIKEMDEKTRKRVVDNVTHEVVLSLIGEFGHVTDGERQRFDKQDKDKAYRDYRKERGRDPWG